MVPRPAVPATTHELGRALLDLVSTVVADAEASWLSGFCVPRTMAGLPVGHDARADVAHTVGLLAAAGVDEVAGHDPVTAVLAATADLDGEATDTFASYRVAETLARFGPSGANAVLDAAPPDQRRALLAATDSSASEADLDRGVLPPNYTAVLARCAVARAALLGPDAAPSCAALVDRTAALLGAGEHGLLDDSAGGHGRYDIYAADVVLFTEPFAAALGPSWPRAAAAALELVEAVVGADGTAVPWGRSTGALGRCLTVELAALVAAPVPGLTATGASWWAGAAATALASLRPWFGGGLLRAHHDRSPYGYRGPHRWAQMTFDVLGKLAWAGSRFLAAPAVEVARPWVRPARDEWRPFESERTLGVWSHRRGRTGWVVPVVGAARSDYLPVPREPEVLDTPVDADLAVGVAVVLAGGRRWHGGGRPTAVRHEAGRLTVTWDGLVPAGAFDAGDTLDGLPCRRQVTYTAAGRGIEVRERMTFEGPVPEGLSLAVAEGAVQPLHVELWSDRPARRATYDTAGMKSWRSFWGPLPTVHELDVDPAPVVEVGWRVTPKVRVLTFHPGHHYHRSLYGPLADRVWAGEIPRETIEDPAALAEALTRFDVFHLHWPEWFLGADVARNEAFAGALAAAGLPVVWTQHNLVPHSRDRRMDAVYALWAGAADVVLHHSAWGEGRVRQRWPFRSGARHVLVPHGHFGNLAPAGGSERRRRRVAAEARLGLRVGALRLGVVGAPRPEKDVQTVIDAVHAVSRDDVELLVASGRGDERVPADPRIHVLPYDFVTRDEYEDRLSTVDVAVLPFADGELLTTGTVGDVVAHGLPAVTGPWPYLAEVLGEAALPYDGSADGLCALIEGLTPEVLARAATAARALRDRYDWSVVAEVLWAELDRLRG